MDEIVLVMDGRGKLNERDIAREDGAKLGLEGAKFVKELISRAGRTGEGAGLSVGGAKDCQGGC